MAHALKPSETIAAWLRANTLGICRRPVSDWVGPPFRPHAIRPVRGNLETVHLTWGVAVVLDLANWRCILSAGEAVAAAVLDDREVMRRAVREYRISLQIFQDDGTYGESLQYSNYPALHLLLTREALIRRDPALAWELPTDPWNLLPRWYAASLFYVKPISGWGAAPRARCANFNDSSAIFRPSGDLLLGLDARGKPQVDTR